MAIEKESKEYYCEKCHRTMNGNQFYSSYDLNKYPNDGKFPICKKCMTMHVDNWKPETYLWILKEADVPYVPDEWNKLMESYARDPSKVTGVTIIGRYLSKMRLAQFKKYRWKDTEFLQELSNAKMKQAMERQGYDVQEIEKAVQDVSFDVPDDIQPPDLKAQDSPITYGSSNDFLASGSEDYFAEQSGEDDEEIELTAEDKKYLRLKWGKTYRPYEWVRLEQMYNDMMESYDIQTAGHIDNLKLVCKTSLKANQLLDIGDIEGAQKATRMYNDLMKSGNFTAAQNKADKGDYVDSISEIVMLCEKDGFIPRYYIDEPNDKVDQTLLDLKRYTKTLITEETNLGNLIEQAIKTNQKEDEDSQLNDSGE